MKKTFSVFQTLGIILSLAISTVVRFLNTLYNRPMHLASVGWHG
jgi:hypothetical protein